MRVALAIPNVLPDWRANVEKMCVMATQAAANNATAIFFSEAAVTGFVNTGDPTFDITLGKSLSGHAITALSHIARSCALWIGVGFFEHKEELLYDSYALLSPQGNVGAVYRRIDTHWHHWHSRPCSHMIYAHGETVTCTSLPIGRASVLLCGDLFNDDGLNQIKRLQPDWLVVPMARGFDSEVFTKEQWHAQDRYHYIERAKEAGANLLLINQLASWNPSCSYFGGAMAVTRAGVILNEFPLELEGMLYVDVE
jgi:N-carbamoylputrescine amidase